MYIIGISALRITIIGIRRFSRVNILAHFNPASLLFALLVLLPIPGLSRDYVIEKFTNIQGLSQSQVFALVEDHYGFLWVGTQKGLNRFNGSSFDKYYKNDHAVFVNHSIWDMEVDSQNKLWLGTSNGLFALSINKLGLITAGLGPFLEKQIIFDLDIYQNKIWTATSNGIFLLEPENDSYSVINKTFSETSESIEYLFIEPWKNDSMLTSNVLDEFYLIGDNGRRKIKSNVRNGFDAELIHKNMLILATLDGLAVFDGNEITKITEEPISEIRIPLDITNVGNELWVGTYNSGMYHLINKPDNSWKLIPFRDHELNSVRCIIQDNENNIWVGTDGSGLVRFHPSRFVSFGVEEGLKDEVIWTIASDPFSNKVVVGTYNGIAVINENGISIPAVQKILRKTSVNVLKYDYQGNLFIATDNALFKSPPSLDTLIEIKLKSDQSIKVIYSIKTAPDSSIWLGTDKYPNLLKYSNGQIEPYTFGLNPEQDMIKDIDFDNDGNLWIISNQILASNKGILWEKYEDKNNRFYDLFIDDDLILLGTDNGIWKLENDKLVSVSNGIPSNSSVYSISSDHTGSKWFGTDNGIYRQNHSDNSIKYFTYRDGFLEHETNARASAVDRDGNIWFGTPHGIYKFKQDSKLITPKPHIFISSLIVENKTIPIDDLKGIPISQPGDFIFHLNTIFLGQYHNPVYKFKLEGLHEEWLESSAPTLYFNLQEEKTYNLYIQAIWSRDLMTDIVQFPFVVKLDFWKKKGFFILMMGFFLVLSVISLFKPLKDKPISDSNFLDVHLFSEYLTLNIGGKIYTKSLFKSNIARSLFQLLVLRKVLENRGVSNAEFGKIWWSKINKLQLKNRKNVTVSKIRKFFMDTNLEEIVQYNNDTYIINLNTNQWTCDVLKFLENFQDGEKELKINNINSCLVFWERALIIHGTGGLSNEMNIKEINKYGKLLRRMAAKAAESLVPHMDKISNPKTIEIINKFKK